MKTALFLITECIVIALIYWGEITASATAIEFSVPNISYNSHDPNLSTPREFKTSLGKISEFQIRLRARADHDVYDNLFQTADGTNGIRLELTHPRKLHLALGDNVEHYLTVLSDFHLGVWHDITLIAVKDQFIDLIIDGEKVFSTQDPSLTELKFDFDLIAVGTGFARARQFQGEISNFTMSVNHMPWGSISDKLVLVLCAGLSLGMLWSLYREQQVLRFIHGPTVEVTRAFRLLGLFTIALAAGWILGELAPRFGTWYPIILVGLILPFVPWLARTEPRSVRFPLSWVSLAVGSSSLFYLLGSALRGAHPASFGGAVAIAAYAAFGTALLCVANSGAKVWNRLLVGAAIFTLSLGSWAALRDLPNWSSFVDSLHRYTSITLLASALCLGLAWQFVVSNPSKVQRSADVGAIRFKSAASTALVYGVFFMLSFRHDSLFLGASEFHWEYFVGPIRSLRNGFWLLWDVPSQYGVLNLLIASLLPASNSWQALYLFQGMLLLAAASLAYHAIITGSPRNRLPGFLVVVAGIFFADPELIGPSLYPSSSVIRFFWCYVLLFLLSRAMCKQNDQQLFRSFIVPGFCVWLLGVLWAFESAVYCSAIYFAALLAGDMFPELGAPGRMLSQATTISKTFLKRCLIAGALLYSLVLIASAYYLIRLGKFPDLRMYLEHATSYAGGFGSLTLKPNGAAWTFLLAFLGVASLSLRGKALPGSKGAIMYQCGALGAMLAISTYFVGRASPSNVTAVLPIIILALATSLKTEGSQGNTFHPALAAIAVPLFALTLISSFGSPRLVRTLQGLQSMSPGIEERLPISEPSLAELLHKAAVGPSENVVYYGFDAAMPAFQAGPGEKRLPYEKTWLVNPLQLLEEPIKPRRQKEIILRSLGRAGAGYFVQKKGQAEDRVAVWLAIISETHSAKQIHENDLYRIIRFEPISRSSQTQNP
jgi:hypothetical protein